VCDFTDSPNVNGKTGRAAQVWDNEEYDIERVM
jgi:hypothetical protein